MSNRTSTFKKIDEFIFTQLENFKASSAFQQMLDLTSSLDEEVQKKINYSISIFIVIFPILIIFFLVWKNTDAQNDLKIKRNIQASTTEISSKIRRLKNVEANLIGPSSIASDGELQNTLNSILKPNNIPFEKIRISDFDVTESITNLKRVSAKLEFSNLSLNDLTLLLRDLISREKMIIPDLIIKRDPESELLMGSIKIYHHFRNE